MPSIWTRRFPNPSPRAVRVFFFAFVLAIVLIVSFGPFLYGTCIWACHRSIHTYDISFKLPFRWIVDDSGSAVTFYKPESLAFAGMSGSSSLEISQGSLHQDAHASLLKFQSQLNLPKRSDPYQLALNGHSGVWCMQAPTAFLGPGVIDETCLVDNSPWSFIYRGSDADFHDAQTIMANILAASRER